MTTRTTAARRELRLRLLCLAPPVAEEADFGLQDRRQALLAGEPQVAGGVAFTCAATAARREDGGVRFSGPHVHGPAVTSFLYLSLKRRGDHAEPWIKRLKVPLPTFVWDEIAALPEDTVLAASVAGTGSGTVPLLGVGWAPGD